MEDLCSSIRTIQRFSTPSSTDEVEEWMESIPEILETAEESVINELTDILTKKMQNGLPTEIARDLRRKAGEVVGAGPIGRVNYDIYGILDLIQQHVQTIGSGKIVSKVVEISLQVAKQSPYKYLRCKAFEVLAQLNSRPNLGEAPTEAKVEEMITQTTKDQWSMGCNDNESDPNQELFPKVAGRLKSFYLFPGCYLSDQNSVNSSLIFKC
jgi:hypothetical protein